MSTPTDMSGILGPNKYKKQPKQPDYTGTVTIRDEVLRIAAWKRKNDEGGSFLSLKFSEPMKKEEPAKTSAEEKVDDFPF